MPDEWSQYEVKPQTPAPTSGWDQYEVKKKEPTIPVSAPTADLSGNGLKVSQSSQASTYSPAVYTPDKQTEIKQAQLQQQQAQHDALQKQIKAYTDKLSPKDRQALLDAGQHMVDQQAVIKDGTEENDHYNYMQSPLGKLQQIPQYLASQATHGGLQVIKGLVHLYDGAMNRNNPVANIASDMAFDYADKKADLGLTKGDISRIQDGKGMGNKALSAAGMVANFAPTVLGGEALQSPKGLLYLQGLGQGKELADKIPGLHPLAKEGLIQGSGAVNLLLSDLGNNMFGQLPSSVKGKVVTNIAADALKEAAEKGVTSGDGVQSLLQNGAKTFADKLEQGGLNTLKSYTDNVKTFAKLNVGNFAMHKGVDALNQAEGGDAVFNETPGDLAVSLYKTVTQDAPMFSAIPALRAVSELAPYSELKNGVIQSLHENPSEENITATKQALEEHGKQAGWTPEQIKATTDHVDQIGSVMKSLPKGVPSNKIADAIDLVQGRNELQKQLEASTTGRDEALAETPSTHEQLLTDKIDQANDKLRDIVSGKKTTYSKGIGNEEGQFFKTFAGKKEDITPERYELEHFERTAKNEQSQPNQEVPANTPEAPAAEDNKVADVPVNEEPTNNQVEAPAGETINPDSVNTATEPTFKDKIANLFSKLKGTSKQSKEIISEVSPVEAATIKEKTGLDVDGYKHIIDNFGINHALTNHGNENVETKRGQIAITQSDFEKIPEIINSPDNIEHAGKTKVGRDVIKYTKKFDDGTTYYLEEERAGKKELALVTMYKGRRGDADSKEPPYSSTSETTSPDAKVGNNDKITNENLTGIRNADVAKERGADIPRDKMTHEQIDAEGKRLVDSGEINPDEFAKQVINEKKAVTAEQEAALLYRKTQLKNRQRAILKDENPENNAANQQEYAHNEDLLEQNRKATEIAGNVSGRSLGYRRQLMKEDYSLAHLLARAKLFNGGEEIDAETKAKLEEHSKRITELENKLLDREDEIRKLKDKQTITEVKRTTEFENRKARRGTTKASLRKEREELVAELMHLAAKSRSNIGANKIPFEFLAPIAKLARNYVMDGALTITQVADKIYHDLKEHLPGVTKEDIQAAISDQFDKYLSEKNAERLASAKKRQLTKLEKLKEGDYEQKVTHKIQVDVDYLKIRAEIAREQTLINKRIADIVDSKKSIGQKIADVAVKYGRQAKLASVTVLGKLAAAGLTTAGLKPLEEAVGGIYSKALPKIAKQSNIEGGINVRALANAYAKAAIEGMKDAADEMNIKKGGQSDLSALYGKYRATKLPAEAAEFFGHLHSAIKAPFKRLIWEHSYAKRIAKGMENGVDVTDPVIDAKYRLDAYKDAERAIFMGDNTLSTLYETAAKYLENSKNSTARGAGALTRILFPFVKVPTNIVLETLRYAGGLIPGATKLAQVGASTAARMAGAEKLAKFIHSGIGELTPEESDIVLRNLKKGSIGAAALAIGFFNPKSVGGYYQPGEKRKPHEVEALQIGHLPIFLTEHPIFQAMQIGATYRRLLDAHRHKDDKVPASILGTAAGIAENIPLASGAQNITEALNSSHKMTKLISSTLKGEFEPAVIQQIARITDTRNHAPVTLNPNNMVKRKPDAKHGMINYIKQDLKTGIPLLRKQVPRK